jgi:methylated-DNA-[protein]-cysteine S-methyltransferase
MIHYTCEDSPLGQMLLTAQDGQLTGVYFIGQKYEARPRADWVEDASAAPFPAARQQFAEYFDGKRNMFDLPLAPQGTAFQQRVWQGLLDIACGDTMTYGGLASAIGFSSSVRAVGAAVGRNPISVIIPCHRVIGADGSLTGYAGGLERKRALLVLEGVASQMAPQATSQYALELRR